MIPNSVQWIFLTHHHRDHIGSVELLRKEKKNLRVAASQKTASLVSFEIDHIICDNDLICMDDEVQFYMEIYRTPQRKQFRPYTLQVMRKDIFVFTIFRKIGLFVGICWQVKEPFYWLLQKEIWKPTSIFAKTPKKESNQTLTSTWMFTSN